MDNSLLVRLPRELRDEIWTLVLTQEDDVRVVFTYAASNTNTTSRMRVVHYVHPSKVCEKGNLLALTATCKQVREETVKLFYQQNAFELCVQPNTIYWGNDKRNFAHYLDWMQILSGDGRQAIRHIILHFGSWGDTVQTDIYARLIATFVNQVESENEISPTWTFRFQDLQHRGDVDVPLDGPQAAIDQGREQQISAVGPCIGNCAFPPSLQCQCEHNYINIKSAKTMQLVNRIVEAVQEDRKARPQSAGTSGRKESSDIETIKSSGERVS